VTGAAPFNVGDVFTIAGVTAVNPQSRVSLGYLRQFVVQSATAIAANQSTITFLPPIYYAAGPPPEPRQNVTALPIAGAQLSFPSTVTAGATAAQNMAFHRDAFTVASVDLEMPGGVDMAARVASKKLGFSMRLVRQYDINNDNFPCRIDVLYGWGAMRPQMACRILG
jgi:hypothetical protein